MPAWYPLHSSNVDAIAKDGADLLVRFYSSKAQGFFYRYPGASRHFARMLKAPSPGKYVHQHLLKIERVSKESME